MKKKHFIYFVFLIFVLMINPIRPAENLMQDKEKIKENNYIIEKDSDVAVSEPGPHKGGGMTTGQGFFEDVPGLELVFKKRALHPGSGIGYHEQKHDEIYYILSGNGELTMNGIQSIVEPGTAILTRAGASHGLRQRGAEDLVIFIVYAKE